LFHLGVFGPAPVVQIRRQRRRTRRRHNRSVPPPESTESRHHHFWDDGMAPPARPDPAGGPRTPNAVRPVDGKFDGLRAMGALKKPTAPICGRCRSHETANGLLRDPAPHRAAVVGVGRDPHPIAFRDAAPPAGFVLTHTAWAKGDTVAMAGLLRRYAPGPWRRRATSLQEVGPRRHR